ncbi:hypothetical protein [Roseovarius atlanticus]|uniref:hypothetical protein n=1 Tax=Roseovarius atlanticus TaxID=1641875 RepID=UPI00070E25E0|nr:hypothetical protein [Roseovarius atlanticus]
MNLRGPHILPAAVAGAVLLGACARDDEASMRARLAPWFSLGETLAFSSRARCAAAAFRLVSSDIGAAVPVERNVPDMLRALPSRGVAALDDPKMTPDAAMVDAVNTQRTFGMQMRRAGLEARPCMEGKVGAEFRRLLMRPETVLAYETTDGTLMLMDRANRVLVVAAGDRA